MEINKTEVLTNSPIRA